MWRIEVIMEKKKFTKCECCPYYGKKEKGWQCNRDRGCIFKDYNGNIELGLEIIKYWLNANNGVEVK